MSGKRGDPQRVLSLDVIRGLAILGILFMNIFAQAMPHPAYFSPNWNGAATDSDYWIYAIQTIFFDGRFLSLFSLLFGASLVIQTNSWQKKQQAPGKWIQRRLFWLALFGAIHACFIWAGDILFVYAITGLALYRAVNWQPGTQLSLGVICITIPMLLIGLLVLSYDLEAMTPPMLGWFIPLSGEQETMLIQAATGDFLTEQIPLNIKVYHLQVLSVLPIVMLHTGGLMLMGMALYSKGFFSQTDNLVRWCCTGLIANLLAALIYYYRGEIGFNTELGLTVQLLNMYISIFCALSYAKVIIFITKKHSFLIQPFIACGRMAFTLYIFQSLATVTLFQWLFPATYGSWDRVSLFIIVFFLSLLQIVLANAWMKKHKTGPLEKIWRYLVVGKQALIRV